MRPESHGKTPAIALSSVDFPAPLEPMTLTKSPASSFRLTCCSATTSSTVPAKNVLVSDWMSRMAYLPWAQRSRQTSASPPPQRWCGKDNDHKHCSHQVEIVGTESQA